MNFFQPLYGFIEKEIVSLGSQQSFFDGQKKPENPIPADLS